MNMILIAFLSLGLIYLTDKKDQVPSAVYSWDDFEVTKHETRESRPVLKGSTSHLSYFEVHATTLHAGEMPHSKHTHEKEEELILVREGGIKIVTPKQEKIIGPGGMALMLPGEEHSLENAADAPATYYILKFRSKAPMDISRSIDAGGSITIDRAELDFKSHDKGGRWNYFDRPTASCEDFEMHATSLKAHVNSHPPHTHAQEEIILMLKGNAKMHIDGKEYATTVGDVIFLDSMHPHGITNSGDETCEYFAFQWK